VRARRFAFGLAAALLAAVVFLPTVRFDFTNWDDIDYVRANPVLVSGKLSRLVDPTETTADAWTPLTIASHALERAVFGEEAAGYHAVNVALHAGCAGLVVAVLLGAGVPPAAAFIGGALQVESVAWVSGRKNLLSTFLLLCALLAFRRRGAAGPMLGTGLGALALLAKPTAVVVVPLVVLDRLRSGARSWRQNLLELAPLFLAAVVVGLLAMHQQGEARAEIAGEPAWVRLLTMTEVAAIYLRRLVAPMDLAAYYSVDPVRSGEPAVLALLVGIALLAGAAAWRLRRNRQALFLLAWIPLAAFPHANVIGGPFWMADRYVYLPMVGAAGLVGLAASWLLEKSRGPSRWGIALGIALALGAFAFSAVKRSEVWRSSLILWQDTLDKAPHFAEGYLNLGSALAFEGRHEDAARAYRRAVELRPADARALASLGNAYDELGRRREAVDLYKAALESDPKSFAGHYNLAIILQEEGLLEDAVGHYRQALSTDPESWIAWNNLGNTYQTMGRGEAAVESYRRALEVNTSYTPALVNLGDALRRLGRVGEAEESYRRAIALEPALVEAHYGLALAAAARGDLQSARDRFVLVLELDPSLDAARRSLARIEERLTTRQSPR
jgi:tetratricopeptide (TPR) repeat protein